jgi:hypothetical protein
MELTLLSDRLMMTPLESTNEIPGNPDSVE